MIKTYSIFFPKFPILLKFLQYDKFKTWCIFFKKLN